MKTSATHICMQPDEKTGMAYAYACEETMYHAHAALRACCRNHRIKKV